jgi:hypothetical protein
LLVGAAAVVVVSLLVGGALLLRRGEEGARQDLQILQSVRKVCKLATVEVSLADYSRRSLPRKLNLPFTQPPEAFLFYAGVISAGFDVCDEPSRIKIDHSKRVVEMTLPPPRVLSLDIKRFEIINERSGLLNTIGPADRNQWYQDARDSLKAGALGSGILAKAESHARELLGSFIERWGYTLTLSFDGEGPSKGNDKGKGSEGTRSAETPGSSSSMLDRR